MNKIILFIVLIVGVVFFWPKPYETSPGFVTPEMQEFFEQTRKQCLGFSVVTNPDAVAADAPGEGKCFGWSY